MRVTEREGGVRISCGSFFSKKKGISLVSGRVTFRSAKRPKSQGVNTVERKLFLFPPFADVCQALKTGPIFTNDSRIRKCHATHESASKIRRWAPLCRVITITLGIYLNFVFISPGKKEERRNNNFVRPRSRFSKMSLPAAETFSLFCAANNDATYRSSSLK